MIWLFGASLLHLTYAARNELRSKSLLHFILIGMLINFVTVAVAYIPYTSLFGTIAQSWMEQISFIIVLFIAKKKFFPAMNSRVIDAYHLHNTNVYLQQKKLLKQYKLLVSFFLFTFELYIFKNIFFFNLYAIFQSICVNPCWFNVTYQIPMFTISESTNILLHKISAYFLIFGHIIDLIVYIDLILISLLFIYITSKRYLQRRYCDSKKDHYRYQVYSTRTTPLLSAAEKHY
ncbi:hypothetical protein LOD99_11794 [Oopsacas minuta]|uniref:7TM GPCR serpentine receptor class x (Srx) domain-containing protein n=1 Tax=Oopsacas minuta TaxID=111878 RepID=A0AAV7JKT2_9METZ|nr:hypothetical protein LOD99_11772 [Oopsacas minuta]KAI6649429.1 hypothetical protein LOD99_11794 [Oopsacas minuta]